MRRLIVGALLLTGLAIAGAHRSQAATTNIGGYCFSGPANTLVSCSLGTPSATPIPVSPVKTLSVGPPVAGPFDTVSYNVSITSQISCFALAEPTDVFTLGSPGAAVLTELYPSPGQSGGSSAEVLVDQNPNSPHAGTAQLTLEVGKNYLGPEGLDLKAVWPDEGVERVVNIVAPAPPTATPTGQPTATSTATPTATPTLTPTPKGTPATPTPVTVAALHVQACVQPDIMNGATLGGGSGVLNGLTSPSALCGAQLKYLDGTVPVTFDGSARPADANGLVSFPFGEKSTAGGGIARITCTLGGLSQSACTGFLILQSGDGNLTDAQKLDLLTQIRGIVADPARCAALFSP